MMDRQVFVYADLQGVPHFVGRLWARARQNRESASFEYDESWLQNPERFTLEPALTLGAGTFHTAAGRTMFGAIGDSAPDRWGRVLMRRAERRRAEEAHEPPRTLREIDYLLNVDDEARQGALRFAGEQGGPFLAQDGAIRIPPLIELPRLLAAAERFVDENEGDEDLRILLAPGSSLGGARPKASIRDRDGQLAIAKFPHHTDEYRTVLWEAVALSLAGAAGLPVPEWRIENVAGRAVLILRRFDRQGALRVPFLSAMSMLGATDNETRSYLEFVDALRQYGAAPKNDMRRLWRQIVFNILVSNTDDHLRNHGFLYAGRTVGGYRPPTISTRCRPISSRAYSPPRLISTAVRLRSALRWMWRRISSSKRMTHGRSPARSDRQLPDGAIRPHGSGWRAAR